MTVEPDDIPEGPRLLRASQVADLFGVHPKTVYAWIKAGKLVAIRTPLGGIRIASEQVAKHLMPPAEEESNTP